MVLSRRIDEWVSLLPRSHPRSYHLLGLDILLSDRLTISPSTSHLSFPPGADQTPLEAPIEVPPSDFASLYSVHSDTHSAHSFNVQSLSKPSNETPCASFLATLRRVFTMSGALLRGTEGVRRAGTPTVSAGSVAHQQPLALHSSSVVPSLHVSVHQPSSSFKVDSKDARFAQATLPVNRPRSRSDILPTLQPTKPIIRATRSASNTTALIPRPCHSLLNSTASSLANSSEYN